MRFDELNANGWRAHAAYLNVCAALSYRAFALKNAYPERWRGSSGVEPHEENWVLSDNVQQCLICQVRLRTIMSTLDDSHAIETFKSLPSIAIEMLKSLVLVNGGAAVAMLAFLGQAPLGRELASHAWLPLGCFAGGVSAGVLAFVGAYLTQLTLYGKSAFGEQHKGLPYTVFLLPSIGLVIIGTVCFVAGALTSVYTLANYPATKATVAPPAAKSPGAAGPNSNVKAAA
jgi:hypothetical protein